MTAEPLITFDRVTRIYGKETRKRRATRALDEVSFDIRRGERFGIVGESGSGKSTLIRLLAGLDNPTSGRITFDGNRISGRSERELTFLRSQLQFVFQDPMSSLDPRMKTRDIIAEPLIRVKHPDPHGRVLELLAAVGLPADAADRYPHQFSGGQRQRISIARALAPNPAVLVADEPVSALDVSVRAQILNLLNDLRNEFDFTLVFVSHDLSVIRYLCDRVAVLRHGELIEVDDTDAVYSDDAAPYTRALVAAAPSLQAALARARDRASARKRAPASRSGSLSEAREDER